MQKVQRGFFGKMNPSQHIMKEKIQGRHIQRINSNLGMIANPPTSQICWLPMCMDDILYIVFYNLFEKHMLVKLYAGNYNTANGLVKQSIWFIQSINHLYRLTHIVNTYHFKIPSLGKMQNNSIQLNANDIDFEWMLIKALTQDVEVKKMQPCLIMKPKFIVQLAAAKTIHQAQILTMDELLFHPTDIPYATLSHICTKEKLYFSQHLFIFILTTST